MSTVSSSIAPQAPKSDPRFLRAMIMLSVGISEKSIFRANNVMAEDLADAIAQKAAPIIVSGTTLNNFFSHLKQLPQEEEAFFNPLQLLIDKYKDLIKQEKARTIEFDTFLAETRLLDLEFDKLQDATEKLNPLFIKPSFNSQEWEIYKHTNADIYLLIPLAYKTRIQKKWDTLASPALDAELQRLKISSNELMLGLRTENKVLKKLASAQELEKELNSRWGGLFGRIRASNPFEKINSTAIKEIFVSDKSPYAGYWNIFMNGHGWLSRSTYAEGEDPRAQIANLDLKQFQDFLSFLDRKVSTVSLFVASCFLGGTHTKSIGKYLKTIEESREAETIVDRAKPNYMVIVSGISDISVGTSTDLKFLAQLDPAIGTYNFKHYFEELESLFTPIINQIQGKSLQEQQQMFDNYVETNIPQLAPIIDTLTHNQEADEDFHSIGGIPSIRLSKWNDFKVVPSEGIVVVDSELLAKQQSLEVQDAKAIIFTVSDIPIPLTITLRSKVGTPAFVMQSSPKKPYTFEKITIHDSLSKQLISFDTFLSFSIFQLQSPTLRLFFIKELTGKNYPESGIIGVEEHESISIKNMWIEKVARVSLLFEIQNTEGKVVFELNGNYYKGVCTSCIVPIVWRKIDQKEYANIVEQMKKNL
jgi:hypothetical protein